MRLTTVAAALLLASAHLAWAQGQTAPPVAATPALGTIDVAPRVTSTDGDEARYERYRDLRNGVYTNLIFGKETADYVADFTAENIGYRDQKYVLDYKRNKVKFNFTFDSIPLNYSYMSATPYTVGDNGVLTIDPSVRASVQGPTDATNDGTAVGVPCAPGAPPGTCNNATTADLAKVNRSIYATLATPFDLEAKRETAGFDVAFSATSAAHVTIGFKTTKKSGHQPWGGSFAFSDAVEMPLPIDNRTNDFTAGLEYAAAKGMIRFAWDGSWFSNDVKTLTWDNPIRATDYNNGRTPPNGPYNSSGYSNGLGPATGRMALAPDNSMNVFSVTGLYKLPSRTNVNGTFQYTTQDQDDTLIPWTINPVIASQVVYDAFPHLASLPRSTAGAKATGLNFLVNLNSRPMRNVGFTVRYRYNKRDNETPQFDATEYVRFDAVPEEIEEGFSHQYDITRQTFDANVLFSITGVGGLRVGYGHDAYERHGRGFADTGENTFRVSFDTTANQYVSLRVAYDVASRRGDGYVDARNDYEGDVGYGSTQPTLRYYDEADRDRNRASVVVTVTPNDTMDVFVSFASGQDEYLIGKDAPVSRPNELFGLEEADTMAWSVGLNVFPIDTVAFGASYGQDEFSSLQRSRNANPPPDPSWTDPSRDWTLDNDETVTSANVYLDLLGLVERTDVHLSYDFSDSDNAFVHGGPRVAALTTASQFIALPNVTNQWNRLSADVRFAATEAVSIGLTYWYEKLEISDYNTIDSNGPVGLSTVAGKAVTTTPTGDPRVDWLGGLITGYGNRAYTGNTLYARLIYAF